MDVLSEVMNDDQKVMTVLSDLIIDHQKLQDDDHFRQDVRPEAVAHHLRALRVARSEPRGVPIALNQARFLGVHCGTFCRRCDPGVVVGSSGH